MLEADLDGNGTIEFPEFLELMKEKYGTDDEEGDLRYTLLLYAESLKKRNSVAIVLYKTSCSSFYKKSKVF